MKINAIVIKNSAVKKLTNDNDVSTGNIRIELSSVYKESSFIEIASGELNDSRTSTCATLTEDRFDLTSTVKGQFLRLRLLDTHGSAEYVGLHRLYVE